MSHTAVYFYSLTISDYKSFKGENMFHFAHEIEGKPGFYSLPQCTVFLGDNGTGKTNILKVIANLQPTKVSVTDVKSNNKASGIEDYKLNIEIQKDNLILNPQDSHNWQVCYRPDVIERYQDNKYSVAASFVVYRGNVNKISNQDYRLLGEQISDGKYVYTTQHSIGYGSNSNAVEYDVKELDSVAIFGYGVNRFADTQRNLGSDSKCDTLFYNDKPLLNFEEWLLQLDIASKDKEKGPKANKRIKLIKNILRDSSLFPGITDFRVYVDDNLHSSIIFETEFGELTYKELGYGYQCMMAWIFDFIKKMFDRYSESDAPLKEPAILIVDEIDLHLHPHWQRHVLRDLCQLFPATQLIVSTHSPLVIQSLSNMNLFLLTNSEGKTNVKEYAARTFQGWTVEEILHELMCLEEDTRSQDYRSLRLKFEHALNSNNLNEGIIYYRALKAMLHPDSVEADMLEMDMDQLKAGHND